jgi:hypothetical protein
VAIVIPILAIKIILFIVGLVGWYKLYAFVHAMYEKCYPAQSIGEDFARGPINLVIFLIPIVPASVIMFGQIKS